MNKNKKQRRIMLLLILILGITIGFALLSTTLKINGSASIKSNTWNIHWNDESINVNSGSVEANLPVVSKTTSNKDTVSFDVELELPGDFYEFEIDAINEGSIDGALDLAENWITYKIDNVEGNLPSYMDFSVKYDDNTTPTSGDVLAHGESKTYKIRVEYKSNVEELPENPDPVEIIVEIPYIQHKENCPTPVSFSSDEWSTIARNVKKGNTSAYSVGDTKTVDLGSLGTHTVRISNKSTPSECSGTGFSETACGFVVEFTDVVVKHRMNPYEGSDTTTTGLNSKGGWEYSDMRAYLNSTTYAYENIDYSTTGLYSKLPSDLKDVIVNTKVVSGHNINETTNFVTTDKLYLLSTHEVWEDIDGDTSTGMDYWDTAYNNTRQLDYYAAQNVTTNNYSAAIKEDDESSVYWFLRSAAYKSLNWTGFTMVDNWGNWYMFSDSNYEYGVSPAFRIG